jgi:hypothetical protein
MPRPSDQGIRLRPRSHTDNPISSHSHIAAETGKGNYGFYLTKYPFHISKGSLPCRKILRDGADDFTSSPKKEVLRIFVALKSPLPSDGYEPTNLGSNGKHASHQILEDSEDGDVVLMGCNTV